MRAAEVEWEEFVFGGWNAGAGTLEDLLDLFELAAAVAGQEFGDRREWLNDLRRNNIAVITGRLPGQSSTPLMSDRLELDLVRIRRWLLAPAQFVGEGAGPPRLKAKWLIGGLFRHRASGRLVWLFSCHYVASQQYPRRRAVAMAMSGRLKLRVAGLRHGVFVEGDFNAEIDRKVTRLLLGVLRPTQLASPKRLRTHGRRGIDLIWWKPKRWIRFVRHFTVANHSDHDAVLAQFLLKPRRKEKHR